MSTLFYDDENLTDLEFPKSFVGPDRDRVQIPSDFHVTDILFSENLAGDLVRYGDFHGVNIQKRGIVVKP